ncbi:hypothetical protein Tco_0431417 [Tanacetum coccineum]
MSGRTSIRLDRLDVMGISRQTTMQKMSLCYSGSGKNKRMRKNYCHCRNQSRLWLRVMLRNVGFDIRIESIFTQLLVGEAVRIVSLHSRSRWLSCFTKSHPSGGIQFLRWDKLVSLFRDGTKSRLALPMSFSKSRPLAISCNPVQAFPYQAPSDVMISLHKVTVKRVYVSCQTTRMRCLDSQNALEVLAIESLLDPGHNSFSECHWESDNYASGRLLLK